MKIKALGGWVVVCFALAWGAGCTIHTSSNHVRHPQHDRKPAKPKHRAAAKPPERPAPVAAAPQPAPEPPPPVAEPTKQDPPAAEPSAADKRKEEQARKKEELAAEKARKKKEREEKIAAQKAEAERKKEERERQKAGLKQDAMAGGALKPVIDKQPATASYAKPQEGTAGSASAGTLKPVDAVQTSKPGDPTAIDKSSGPKKPLDAQLKPDAGKPNTSGATTSGVMVAPKTATPTGKSDDVQRVIDRQSERMPATPVKGVSERGDHPAK